MYDICSAILAINPSAQMVVAEEDLDRITWQSGTAVIPKADIQAKMAELKTAYDAKDYQRKRQPEYPPIVDQLDYIYHNGVAKWKTDMIKPVKDKYSK